MIAYLEGTVIQRSSDSVVLKVGGVGYQVFTVGLEVLLGDEAVFYIYDHVREDRRELYGFVSTEVLKLFEALIGISGVGTKLAQKILSAHSADNLTKKISQGDIEFLTGISGVGKKTAQKIVLEMKGVLALEDETPQDTETLEALMSLGYSRADCTGILSQLSGETVEERVKEALRLL